MLKLYSFFRIFVLSFGITIFCGLAAAKERPSESDLIRQHKNKNISSEQYTVRVEIYDFMGRPKSFGTGYLVEARFTANPKLNAFVITSSHVWQKSDIVKVFFQGKPVPLGNARARRSNARATPEDYGEVTSKHARTANDYFASSDNFADVVAFPIMELPKGAIAIGRYSPTIIGGYINAGYVEISNELRNTWLDLASQATPSSVFFSRKEMIFFNPPKWSLRPVKRNSRDRASMRLRFQGNVLPFKYESNIRGTLKRVYHEITRDLEWYKKWFPGFFSYEDLREEVLARVTTSSFRFRAFLRKSFNGRFYITDERVYSGESGSPVLGPFERFLVDGQVRHDASLVIGHVNSFSPFFDRSHISSVTGYRIGDLLFRSTGHSSGEEFFKKRQDRGFVRYNQVNGSRGVYSKSFSSVLFSKKPLAKGEFIVHDDDFTGIGVAISAGELWRGMNEVSTANGWASESQEVRGLRGGGESIDGTENFDSSIDKDGFPKGFTDDLKIFNSLYRDSKLGMWFKDERYFPEKTRVLAFPISAASLPTSQQREVRYIPASWFNFMTYADRIRKDFYEKNEKYNKPIELNFSNYKKLVSFKLKSYQQMPADWKTLFANTTLSCQLAMQEGRVVTTVSSRLYELDFDMVVSAKNIGNLSDFFLYNSNPDYEVIINRQGLYSTSSMDYSGEHLVTPFGEVGEFQLLSSVPFLQIKIRDRGSNFVVFSEPVFCFAKK